MRPLTSEDKADLAAFPFDEQAEFQALGGALPVGEKGFTTLERRYTSWFFQLHHWTQQSVVPLYRTHSSHHPVTAALFASDPDV